MDTRQTGREIVCNSTKMERSMLKSHVTEQVKSGSGLLGDNQWTTRITAWKPYRGRQRRVV